jgi:hypothetical protein
MSFFSPQLLTQELSEFLEMEFKNFSRVFETREVFEQQMKAEAVQDGCCGTWRWKGCDKKCDCDFLTPNTNKPCPPVNPPEP